MFNYSSVSKTSSNLPSLTASIKSINCSLLQINRDLHLELQRLTINISVMWAAVAYLGNVRIARLCPSAVVVTSYIGGEPVRQAPEPHRNAPAATGLTADIGD